MITFTVLMLGSCLLLHTMLYPLVYNQHLKIIIDTAYIVAAVFAIISGYMDPGRVKKTTDFMSLLE